MQLTLLVLDDRAGFCDAVNRGHASSLAVVRANRILCCGVGIVSRGSVATGRRVGQGPDPWLGSSSRGLVGSWPMMPQWPKEWDSTVLLDNFGEWIQEP